MRLAVNAGRDRAPLYIDVSVFGAYGAAAARYIAEGRESASREQEMAF